MRPARLFALPLATLAIMGAQDFKRAGRDNRRKIGPVMAQVEAARAAGTRITSARPAQLATGVEAVLANSGFALRDGKPSGTATGRIVRGRAWTGRPGGGCRADAAHWRRSR